MLTNRGILLASVLAPVAFVQAEEWSGDFTGGLGAREELRFGSPIDLSSADGVDVDFRCSDMGAIGWISGYFRCGETGWQAVSPLLDEPGGGWVRMRIPKRPAKAEGKPAGWGSVTGMKLVFIRATTNAFDAAVRNVRPYANVPADAQALADEKAKMLYPADETRFVTCHYPWGLKRSPEVSWDELAKTVKDAGFNRLDVNFCRGLYAAYPSKVLRPWPKRKPGQAEDALADCLAACRRLGLRLHAWRCCWTNPQWLTPAAEWTELIVANRLQVDCDGKVMEKKGWLCPTHPENVRLQVESMVELAGKGVDGIDFDYIRYNGRTGCFCARCRDLFARRIGRSLDADWPKRLKEDAELDRAWCEFRRETISQVVREVSARVRKEHPAVKISAFVFEGPAIKIDLYGQDWPLWCRNGWLDEALPMSYRRGLDDYRRSILFSRSFDVGAAKVLPMVGPSVWEDDGDQALVLLREVGIARKAGFGGWGFFDLAERGLKVIAEIGPGKNCPRVKISNPTNTER